MCAPLYISCTVCFCVFLSLCFLQSHSHRITQHCAKGSSSTKPFSITITSSLFSCLSVYFYLSLTCLSVRFFLCFSLCPSPSLSLSLSEISATSADCHIACVCLCYLFVYESKVRYVAEEVKWLLVAKSFNQLVDRDACPCWWRPQFAMLNVLSQKT